MNPIQSCASVCPQWKQGQYLLWRPGGRLGRDRSQLVRHFLTLGIEDPKIAQVLVRHIPVYLQRYRQAISGPFVRCPYRHPIRKIPGLKIRSVAPSRRTGAKSQQNEDEGGPAVGGTLSPGSLSRFKASLERLAVEFEELARTDARLPLAQRDGCSGILAVRSWEFSEFTRLRRVGTQRRRG